MNLPESLKYTKEHEWVKVLPDGVVVFGITDFAQSALGDIVFASMPKVGSTVQAGQTCAEVESTKSVSDIYAPVTGVVQEVNIELSSKPEVLNADPYEKGWMVKLTGVDVAEVAKLMDAASYKQLTEAS